MRYKVTKIDWDIDEPCDARQFPSRIYVDTDEPDKIADLLTDEYGFCIKSMNVEEVSE